MFKYFTWKDSNGYQRGQNLISREQIRNLLQHTSGMTEVFATIQDYDKDGNTIGCPMYFDIDSSSLLEAYSEATSLYYDLMNDFNVKPMLHFSGSKGFHITLPLYIRHPRCHDIMQMIAEEYSATALDVSVYRKRSMWRCDKTRNNKSGMYKTRTHEDEPFTTLLNRARNNQHLDNWPIVKMKDLPIENYIKRLGDSKPLELGSKGGESVDMPPCMLRLWKMDSPPKGNAHNLAYVIVRWCYRSGQEPDEVVALFQSHKFWSGVNENDYKKIINSVYSTGHASLGCKTGMQAELLREYCSELCPFNEAGYGEVS